MRAQRLFLRSLTTNRFWTDMKTYFQTSQYVQRKFRRPENVFGWVNLRVLQDDTQRPGILGRKLRQEKSRLVVNNGQL